MREDVKVTVDLETRTVLLDFTNPVSYLQLTPEAARGLGEELTRQSDVFDKDMPSAAFG